MSAYTPTEIAQFRELADSLQKWRRAEVLDDDNRNVVPLLYEDLLPDEHVLKSFLKPNTSILVGRKGTGKSTLIQRAEHDLKRDEKVITIYIDVKTLHTGTTAISDSVFDGEVERKYAKKVIWFQAFLSEFAAKLTKAVGAREVRTIFGPRAIAPTVAATIQKLSDITNYLKDIEISGHSNGDTGHVGERRVEKTATAGISFGAVPSLDISGGMQEGTRTEQRTTLYGKKFAKYFDIPAFVRDVRGVLAGYRLKYVYVFLDDFSELSKDSMRTLVDDVVCPLETASEELFKFKMAAYPGRYYLGALDRNKIDIIDLDMARLHFRRTAPEMVEAAEDFVGRLLTKRCRFYASRDPGYFFEGKVEAFYSMLYEVSYCNPRAMGWILDFAADDTIARGEPIDITSLKQAAKRYCEEVLERRLEDSRHVEMEGQERATIMLAKEMISAIVERSRELRKLADDNIKFPHQSHFHLEQDKTDLLEVLESYQFVNRFKPARNKDGDLVEIFALDYGACVKHNIKFGTGPDKNYLVQRVFNYTQPLTDVSSRIEYFECSSCKAQHPISEEAAFRRYDYDCPDCNRSGKLQRMRRGLIANAQIIEVAPTALPSNTIAPLALPPKVSRTEYELLSVIQARGDRGVFAKDIAALLDVTGQAAAKMAKRLADDGYVERIKTSGAYRYTLTSKAFNMFFPAKTAIYSSEGQSAH